VSGERGKRGAWRPGETIDVTNDVEVREWAKLLCVTPNELREIIEEIGDRSARVATECGVPLSALSGG
jgi:uncharacterized protein DUF3606